MPKALCILGMVVAALLILIFALDLGIGIPFQRKIVMDVVFIVVGALLGYLSFATYREQT
jgi:hypothetical protein